MRIDLPTITGIPTRAKFEDMAAKAYELGLEQGRASVDSAKIEAELRALGPKALRRKMKEWQQESRIANKDRAEYTKRLHRLNGLLSAHDDLVSVVDGGMTLQRAWTTSLHRLRESIHGGGFFLNRGSDTLNKEQICEYDNVIESAHSFVVQHDWAAAFKNSTDYAESSTFRLPYETCAFEFKVSGHAVIILATEVDGLIYVQLAAEAMGSWFSFERARLFDADEASDLKYNDGTSNPIASLITFLRPQIKAIAVALEAEVATTSVERAPHTLNRSREKKGRPPVADYHIVSLASRSRAAPLLTPQQIGTRRRLHFRRGHWRHFETFKTWVRWTLVGDPDLGFVDKEYRL